MCVLRVCLFVFGVCMIVLCVLFVVLSFVRVLCSFSPFFVFALLLYVLRVCAFA